MRIRGWEPPLWPKAKRLVPVPRAAAEREDAGLDDHLERWLAATGAGWGIKITYPLGNMVSVNHGLGTIAWQSCVVVRQQAQRLLHAAMQIWKLCRGSGSDILVAGESSPDLTYHELAALGLL
jgi:hypothetical protein